MPREGTIHVVANAGDADTMNDMERGRANDDTAMRGFITKTNDPDSH
jgi:hypothetical protein